MDELRELYQEMIIDHGKNPRNFHALENSTHHAEGYNPLCGDQLTLYVEVEDNKIKNAAFNGHGCAISMASASLMTETLKGKTLEQANHLFENFRQLLTTDKAIDDLGKLQILAGVKAFPMRVKCATLAWHTYKAALEDTAESATTE